MFGFIKKFSQGNAITHPLTLSDKADRGDVIVAAVLIGIESRCEVIITKDGNYFDKVRRTNERGVCNN